MSASIPVSRTDAFVGRILAATYPDYRGRKIFIVPQAYPLDVRSYWDGGSRSYYTFLNLATFERAAMPAQSAFDRQLAGADSVTLPTGIACIEHVIFCGKDLGIRIHVNPDNVARILPGTVGAA